MTFFSAMGAYPVYLVDWETDESEYFKTYYRWFIECDWISEALSFPKPESKFHYKLRLFFERIRRSIAHTPVYEEDDGEDW